MGKRIKYKKEGLIEAVEKSIAQWQLMLDNPKMTEKEAHKHLGGRFASLDDSFLCEEINDCIDCINWGLINNGSCEKDGTYYRDWLDNPCPETTQAMLDHLKSELKRLRKK